MGALSRADHPCNQPDGYTITRITGILGHPSIRGKLLGFRSSWTRLTRVWRRIEQGQLGCIGRLETAQPPVKVCVADWVARPGRLRVAGLDASPEFVGYQFEVVQFDADTKLKRASQSHLVTFD